MRSLCSIAAVLVLAGTPVTAECRSSEPLDAPQAEAPPKMTLLLGDQYRWPHLILPLRFAADLVALPASVARWEPQDLKLFAIYAGGVAALMTPYQGLSADTRLQRWVLSGQTPGKYLIWTRTGDAIVWGSIWGVAAGFLIHGWLTDDQEMLESISLTLEAFSVSQIQQVGIKLILGREGPRDAGALGILHGPAGFFRHFPAGTPSGHSASLYAMIGALSGYWQNPALDVAMHLLGLAFCVTLVTDNYHFVSDVLWGAVMGYHTGRWVVRHRSTHYRYQDGALVPAALVPAAVVPTLAPAQGRYGLSLAWAF